jgi:xylosylprotein 4-beta-galactosyltransferase
MNHEYWGWDHEDDEFQHQLERHNISIVHQSPDIGTGYEDTAKHLHSEVTRGARDRAFCNNQWTDAWSARNEDSGMKATKFNLVDIQKVTIEGYEATFLNVNLICDFKKTPWCDCNRSIEE